MFRIFASAVMLMYIPLLIFVGYRLWQVCKHYFPRINNIVYWLIFGVISSSFIFSRTIGRSLPAIADEALTIIGFYWVIAVFYLFIILLILDLIRYTCKFTRHSLPLQPFLPRTGLMAVILVALVLLYGTWNSYNPRFTQYKLTIPKKGGSFQQLHVVMVSDIHLSKVVNNNRLQNMVTRINSLDPDIVLMPGDIIEDADFFIEQKMVETLKGLKSPLGTYISLGNHEYYGGRVKDTVEILEDNDFHVLRDSYLKVAESFYVVGREDPAADRSGAKRKGLKEILGGVDKSLPIFLLNHQPIELAEAENEGVDLQVSGHTHRGQIFPANLITSRIFEQDWGYLKKGSLNLIVSCGYGTWGPPLRIGNTPEIVDITITFE